VFLINDQELRYYMVSFSTSLLASVSSSTRYWIAHTIPHVATLKVEVPSNPNDVLSLLSIDEAIKPDPVVLDLIPRCKKFRKLRGRCGKTRLLASSSGFVDGALIAMSRSAMLLGHFGL
jgi:hypothetical protein